MSDTIDAECYYCHEWEGCIPDENGKMICAECDAKLNPPRKAISRVFDARFGCDEQRKNPFHHYDYNLCFVFYIFGAVQNLDCDEQAVGKGRL